MNRILSAYPKEVFSISENFLEVSFPFEEGYVDSSKKLTDQLGKRRDKTEKTSGKILDMCQENPSITIPEMAEQIGITERSIQRNIQKLQEQGSLRRLGSKKSGFWEVIDK